MKNEIDRLEVRSYPKRESNKTQNIKEDPKIDIQYPQCKNRN